VTDEELLEKTRLFNSKLLEYGRQKALQRRLGVELPTDDELRQLDLMLGEIQTEFKRRRDNP
jgi:hypothetical protein